MYNWMFFPKDEEPDNSGADLALVLDQLRLSPVTAGEWAELVPESHERAQGATLGFCCGNGILRSGGNVRPSVPEIPVVPFVSDYAIEPKCWLDSVRLTIPAVPAREYRIFLAGRTRRVISVTSTFPDRPPSFRVCGSYCFFGPPYVLAPVPPLKF